MSAPPSRSPSAEQGHEDGLNEGQAAICRKFLDIIASGRQLLQVVQGGPGTGKTFLANKFLQKRKKGCRRAAYTGIAASLISGRTLHSLFGLRRKNADGLSFDSVVKQRVVLRDEFKGVELLLIDEVSTLTASMLEEIDKKCREIKKAPQLLFGGLHVILMGDFVQLPPVAAKPLFREPGHIFPKFELNQLEQAMRSNDAAHNKNLSVMQNMEGEFPMGGVDVRPEGTTVALFFEGIMNLYTPQVLPQAVAATATSKDREAVKKYLPLDWDADLYNGTDTEQARCDAAHSGDGQEEGEEAS